ncbi:MAG: hypothetical protein N2039_06200 [Gemmataceae bacterium]|nr:hypothetical protein [Gemmataceae bacterium]
METLDHLRVEMVPSRGAHIRHILMRHVIGHEKLTLQKIATEDDEGGRTTVVATIDSPDRNDRAMEDLVARISIEPEVKLVSWQRSAA